MLCVFVFCLQLFLNVEVVALSMCQVPAQCCSTVNTMLGQKKFTDTCSTLIPPFFFSMTKIPFFLHFSKTRPTAITILVCCTV